MVFSHQKVIGEVEEWVKSKMMLADAGHDWWHIERVRNNAWTIHEQEGGDWSVIELAVLVHDVIDEKLFDPVQSRHELLTFLRKLPMDEVLVKEVLGIIQAMSFSHELDGAKYHSLEFKIVQDADRLDAIGAIGVARAFHFGGQKGHLLYHPEIERQEVKSKEEYRKSDTSTIHHFYEKLLRLAGLMKTQTGRLMAEERHLFLVSYLEQFMKEWGR
jgi:uncharacterized protein